MTTPVAVATAFLLCLFASQIAGELDVDLPGDSYFQRESMDRSLCVQLIQPSGYPCSEYTIQTKDGFLLGLQRVSSSAGSIREQRGPPVLLLHGLFMAGDAWFLNSPEESLGFILADNGFDVWVGNVRGTRWSHGHISLSIKDKDFWDWSWQELALDDLAEMIHYINSITDTKVLVVGHSQGTIVSLAALTQPHITEMVEAAALLCPISYLDHITSRFVLRMVHMHLDQIVLALGIHQLNFRSEWGVDLLDSLCDGRIDCSDLLTSITVFQGVLSLNILIEHYVSCLLMLSEPINYFSVTVIFTRIRLQHYSGKIVALMTHGWTSTSSMNRTHHLQKTCIIYSR
nr:triacylglycerol lipase 1 isoform X2 [Ziziphus jujuba var. spinosa]